MKRIVSITPRDARFGFSLAGGTQLLATPEEAESVIQQTMGDPECGTAIVDERLLTVMGEERFRELERKWSGVLIVLPSPERAEKGEEDYAERLIRRVIGYHVRVQL